MKRALVLSVAALFLSITQSFAYIVPRDDSRAKYFYVFGPQGNPDYGAEEAQQDLYIDVPGDSPEQVYISIFDPNTGGKVDLRPDNQAPWDTQTEFMIYGKNGQLLDSAQIGSEKQYDRSYLDFGPYDKEQGEKLGDVYRFKLTVKAVSGSDENLYYVKVSPEDSQAFAYNFTFRLLEKENDKMYFYPQIAAGTEKIIVENYDMDPDGGSCELIDRQFGMRVKIKDSQSGQWTETVVNLSPSQNSRRLEYVVTKKTQRRANAGIRVKDEKGNLLPIYFRPAAAPRQVPAAMPARKEIVFERLCNNRFIFDATKSYDSAERKLSYFWDFGDGSTSNQAVVEHTYDKAGEYRVALRVRNDSGLECDNDQVSQVIKVNSAPVPDFTAPERACLEQETIFDASGTTDDTANTLVYHWDFGDGTRAEGVRVTKAYQRSGTFKVTLTVNDNENTPCSARSKEGVIKIVKPPLADAGEDIEACIPYQQEYKINFSAGRVKNAEAKDLTYAWDFGDGESGSGRSTSHVYKKGGVYTVKLSVDDGYGLPCSVSSDTAKLTLNKQPVAKAGQNRLACAGSEIDFDGSASYSEDNGSLEYLWDFGDGAKAQGVRVAHAYRKGGKYNVKLIVDDGKGKKCSQAQDMISVSVNTKPVAALADVKPVCLASEAGFDASRSSDADGDILKYTWDFGDGTILDGGAKMTHVYQSGGIYTVKVTVDDQSGTACSSDSQSIKIRVNTPPKANAGPNLVCCVDKENIFDGSGSVDPDGDALTYEWDFGDGTKASGQQVTHKYPKPGDYKVILTVKDGSGTACSQSQDAFLAKVSDKPVSIMEIKKH